MSRPRIRRKSEFARSRGEAAYPELWPTDAWCPSLYPPGGLPIRSLGQNGNLGTLSSNLDPSTLWVVSEGQHAVDFTPTAGVTKQCTTDLDIRDVPLSGTISLWFKPRLAFDAGGTADFGIESLVIVHNSLDYFVMYRQSSGNLKCGWYNDPLSIWFGVALNATIWDVNAWQNYVCTWIRGGIQILYRNGIVLGSNSPANTVRASGDGVFYFGSLGGQYGYDGLMDDVRICNTTWSSDQVMLNYVLGRGGWATRKTRRTFLLAPVFNATAAVNTVAATCSGVASFTVPIVVGHKSFKSMVLTR